MVWLPWHDAAFASISPFFRSSESNRSACERGIAGITVGYRCYQSRYHFLQKVRNSMNLGDELFELKTRRSKGRIGPIEYYESLARLVDASPDAIPSRDEAISTFIRRIEALLEDRLGASGIDIEQKIESRARCIPPDLRSELRGIAALRRAISRGDTLSPVEISGVPRRCVYALHETLLLAEAVSPPDPNIRHTGFPPVWVRRGVVRKVRHSQRQILPGWSRLVQYLALMDIDGRLLMITSPPPPRIECGDWVVVAGSADHEASAYYNESGPSGNKKKGRQTMAWALAALFALASLAGGAVVCLAVSRAVDSHWDLLLIGRCAALALAGALLSWVGLAFAIIMRQVALMARAFEAVLSRDGAA